MASLHLLQPRTPRTKGRRIGRGGKRGTYSGKGIKGQLARSGRKLRPELRDIIKKLPKMRGRGKNLFTSIQDKPAVVSLSQIESAFEAGAVVSPKSLREHGFLRSAGGWNPKVKVLGGEISKKLSFEKVLVSESARAAIEKAGGTIKTGAKK